MKIKNILIAGLTVAGFCSCNDYLDVEPGSTYTNESVFSNASDINTALNGVYAQLLSSDTYGEKYLSTFCLNSDVDMYINSNNVSTDNNYRRFDCTSNGSDIDKTWTAAYRGVEYANNFIYQLEHSPLYDTNDENIMQMMGEAKTLRAMFYHDLVVMFGDIPFTFIPNSNAEDFMMPIVDREEVHKALINDLISIAPYMKFAVDEDNGIERASKEFCWAMIARMALTCGGYSLRPDPNSPSSYGTMKRPDNYREYYDIARQYCDSVITSGKHSLTKSYRQVFIDECNYKLAKGDDPIFEIPFAKESSGSIGYIQGPSGDVDSGGTTAPNIWGGSGGTARLSAFYRYQFDEDDLRRDYVNGMWYYTYKGVPTIRRDYTVHNNKWSKFWTTDPLGATTTSNTGINYPYMRYADVLLMYAETVNELESGVTGANGAKAINALKTVRYRAFDDHSKVDTYIASVIGSKDTFLKAVLDERKWEFAGENMRWRDLVRNNLYSEVIYYSFLRYYSVAENAAGSSDYIESVENYDGKPGYLELNLPYNIYWRYAVNPNDTKIYPNTAMDVLDIFNLYHAAQRPTTNDDTAWGKGEDNQWQTADFYSWWNDTDGCPTNQCLYSFFGFIRGDERGNIYVIDNGNPVTLSGASNLPPVRYILPYPRAAIQRSGGIYKNYYGYN